MKILTLKELIKNKEDTAVAIGFFDGIHTGHQAVIKKAVSYAKQNGLKSVVITFNKRPKRVLRAALEDNYITPIGPKLRILEEMGVDYVLVQPFDASFLMLTAKRFIDDYLVRICAKYVSIGFDFRFGHKGKGTPSDLIKTGKFIVEITEQNQLSGTKISSTRIRQQLAQHNLQMVNEMLGRPFMVDGVVVKGKQLGRKLGFPTANVSIDPEQLLPLRGVYATIFSVDNHSYLSMTNVGYNPTVGILKDVSIESHLFDFEGSLYDKRVTVAFVSKLRNEVQFSGVEKLVKQLEKDKVRAIKELKLKGRLG